MKKPVLLFFLILLAGNLFSAEFVQREEFISGPGETLRNEMWISAGKAQFDGTAEEDLFVLASTVDLHGKFSGAVWSIGDQIIAGGNFTETLRVAGRTAAVSGALKKSLTAVGSSVLIEPTATIEKNVLCYGENVIIKGTIGGNVKIFANRVTVGGKISGDITIAAKDIVVLHDAVLGGNLHYTAPHELILSSSVHLAGNLNRTFSPPAPLFRHDLLSHSIYFLAALLTGILFYALFPHYTVTSVHLLRSSRTKCMLAGVAALTGIPLIIFALLFSLIGFSPGLLLAAFYGILFYLSRIIVALWIGIAVLRRNEMSRRKIIAPLAAGLAVFYALTAVIPIAGIVIIVAAVFGLGALTLALFKQPVFVIRRPAQTETQQKNQILTEE